MTFQKEFERLASAAFIIMTGGATFIRLSGSDPKPNRI